MWSGLFTSESLMLIKSQHTLPIGPEPLKLDWTPTDNDTIYPFLGPNPQNNLPTVRLLNGICICTCDKATRQQINDFAPRSNMYHISNWD